MNTITVVLGTAREGRKSEIVARSIYEELANYTAVNRVYVDVWDHLTTFATTRIEEGSGKEGSWEALAHGAGTFIFVIPEYNRSYPGEWKLLLDSCYKSAFLNKKAFLVGVSSGRFGGVRAVEAATLTLATRGMYVEKDSLCVANINDKLSETGGLNDEGMNEVVSFVQQVVDSQQ